MPECPSCSQELDVIKIDSDTVHHFCPRCSLKDGQARLAELRHNKHTPSNKESSEGTHFGIA